MGFWDWLRGGRRAASAPGSGTGKASQSTAEPVEDVSLELPREPKRIELHRVDGGIEVLAVSADRIFVARKAAAAIDVLDLSGKLLGSLPGHDKSAKYLAVARDGGTIASCMEDGTSIQLWKQDGTLIRTVERPSAVKAIAIEGDALAVGHVDGSIAVLSLSDASIERPLHLPQFHEDGVTAVTLSADGKEVAVLNGPAGLVATWPIGSDKAQVSILPHRVFSLRYSPTGRYLAVVGASFKLEFSLSDAGKLSISELASVLWLSDRRDGASSQITNRKLIFGDVHWHPDKDVIAVIGSDVVGTDFHRVMSFYGIAAVRQGKERPIGSFRLGLGGLNRASAFVPEKGLFVSEEQEMLLGWSVLAAVAP